ncbi:hypothetical protein OTU49_012209 [Cherax quadricarinatus]|uniref:Uncharacterized protein n=1 Tax=Cherax quadricarinatus TaxID=27406 RepID=A0AAW0VZQ3_CHEQU
MFSTCPVLVRKPDTTVMAFQYKRKVLFEDGKNTTYCYVRIKPAMRTDESTQQLPSTSRAGQVEDKTPEKMVITREQRLRMERSYQRALRIREERMARNAENAKNPVVDNSAEDDGVISINSRGYEVRPLHNDGQRILANVPEPPKFKDGRPYCIHCSQLFDTSYYYDFFEIRTCEQCRKKNL